MNKAIFLLLNLSVKLTGREVSNTVTAGSKRRVYYNPSQGCSEDSPATI